jgi:hypothetical protein
VVVHWPRGSAAPAATGAQLPALAPTLHALHDGHDEAEQQTPSTQLPLAHSPPPPHGCPSALRLPQVPLATPHCPGGAQSPLSAQLPLHCCEAGSHL